MIVNGLHAHLSRYEVSFQFDCQRFGFELRVSSDVNSLSPLLVTPLDDPYTIPSHDQLLPVG